MFAGSVSEEFLDIAKEAVEKLMEQQLDGLAITEDEKERIKRERKTENGAVMRGLKNDPRQVGRSKE